jgi:hypothetical protein
MPGKSRVHFVLSLVFCAGALLVSGCVSPTGTYPNPNGPRNGNGVLVDPQTGIVLPGESEGGV